jgi:hypothetical protein
MAQRADSLGSGVRISSFGFSLGAVILIDAPTKQTDVWLKDFNSIVPNNPNLNKDRDTSGQNFSFGQAGFNVNCFLNLKSNKAKTNFAKRSEHRIGLYYTVKPKYQLGFFKADSVSADTFFSNTTGYFKIDSAVTGYGYYYSLKGKTIGIDFSEIIYPFKWRILRPYTGINIGTGISLNTLTVAYNPEGEAYWRHRHGRGLIVEDNIPKETTRLKPSFAGYASIPLGLSLNKKTKPTFISVFIETRFGVKYEKYTTTNFLFTPIAYVQAGIKLVRN